MKVQANHFYDELVYDQRYNLDTQFLICFSGKIL